MMPMLGATGGGQALSRDSSSLCHYLLENKVKSVESST